MSADELAIWLNHFEYHAQHPRRIPPEISDVLSPAERDLIASSIATFQLGEQSEGATLLQAAKQFARAHRQPALERIVQLFIAEEQHHSALLGDFMQDHAIAHKSRDWTDRAFRRLRHLAGLELYLYVLITAELIGILYYRSLETATDCVRLKVLCRNLVCDELAHVGFESHLLLELRRRRSAATRTVLLVGHRIFMAVTAAVVWSTQQSVLQRAGYNRRAFLRACLAQHDFYLKPAKWMPASGAIPEPATRNRRAGVNDREDRGGASGDRVARGGPGSVLREDRAAPMALPRYRHTSP